MPEIIMLAAGGTGGHVFPAISVGEHLKQRGYTPYFITDKRGKHMIPKQYPCLSITAASPFAPNPITRLMRLAKLGIGLVTASIVMLVKRPRAIIGFGGYPAAPPVIAGHAFGLPVMLHEQNASLGRANRFLSRYARLIAMSWPHTNSAELGNHIERIVSGTPVREAFHHIGQKTYTPPDTNGQINLLVVGGSLGASVFGDTVPVAIGRLPEALKKRLRLVHQVRKEQIEQVRKQYNADGISADITPFIADMAKEMGKAHLVICRAGASSVAELAAAGRPALLVPYPDAMDDHQTANARTISEIGGGWLTPEKEMSAGSLAGKIAALVADPARLTVAATNITQLARPDAAAKLAELAIALADGNARKEVIT